MPATLAAVDDARGVALAWMDYREREQGVYFAGTDADLNVNRAEKLLANESVDVALAATGEGYGLARADGNAPYFLLLDAEGNPRAAEQVLSVGDATRATAPSVAWDGAGFGVVWLAQSGEHPSARFTHLDAAGREEDARVLAEDAAEAVQLWTGDAFAALYSAPGDGVRGLVLAELDRRGDVNAGPWVVSPAAADPARIRLAFGDDAYAVAWTELDAETEAHVYVRRIGRDGEALASDLSFPGWLGGLTFTNGSFYIFYSRGLTPASSYVLEVPPAGAPVVRTVDMPEPITGKIESRLVPNLDALAVAWVGGSLRVSLADLRCP